MGTRHLTMVVQDGVYKVAQYGQWDGYPSCAGTTILQALHRAMNDDFSDFEEKIRSTSFVSKEEIQKRWKDVGADESGFVDASIADIFKNKWPQLNRDMGYEIIDFIIDQAPSLELDDRSPFAADSLFCEFAYVIDLDRRTFEVYEGFNTSPLNEHDRFYALMTEGKEYTPVKMIKSYDIDALPTTEVFSKDFAAD